MFKRRKASTSNNIGCGYMFTTGFLIVFLLVMNAIIVRTFLSANLANVDERINQASQFVLPVAMIFFEFWFYDLITRRQYYEED